MQSVAGLYPVLYFLSCCTILEQTRDFSSPKYNKIGIKYLIFNMLIDKNYTGIQQIYSLK